MFSLYPWKKALALLLVLPFSLRAEDGSAVVVVFNRNVRESRAVADHYAEKRSVPKEQIIGLDLPFEEVITRTQYRNDLQKPLWKEMVSRGLFTVENSRVVQSKVRYAALCYGIPLKIKDDPSVVEPGTEKLPAEIKRNDAAVDNELALLPLFERPYLLTGPMVNSHYRATNAASLHPTNGVLLVARLDGPTAKIAENLVDLALVAERNGLWGRAYFDLQGLKDGGMKQGDDWMRAASEAAKRKGFETYVDEKPEVIPPTFPMSQIALYAGWYAEHVSGPFTLPKVEFMPGAFVYHLHSHNAFTLRSTNQHWAGPFLNHGATALLGSVAEPYLGGTPNIGIFFERFLNGFSLGEAAYACNETISWQTTVVGDPLYRPFEIPQKTRHEGLEKNKSELLDWSNLMVVNLNLLQGAAPAEMIQFLEAIVRAHPSAILWEKLGDLQWQARNPAKAFAAWREALRSRPSPMQALRILLELADRETESGHPAEALKPLEEIVKSFPQYPGRAGVEQRIKAAKENGKTQ